ncbi:MAG TPA: methyltransferase domain-containing protein [Ignavibacteria bacterium]|jgi:SAM-dependent methyltransferase
MNSEIIQEQRKSWNEVSSGWKKWNKNINQWYQPISGKIIELAEINSNSNVLDIATGPGEPGLTAAKHAANGLVTGIDISDEMVKIANQFARERNIGNYKAIHYDGINLPFADNHFDAVISRCGIFFFPDTHHILKEIFRVLKPGSRVSVSAWCDITENESSLLVEKIATEYLKHSFPKDSPGPFRFSDPTMLISEFEGAGFRNIKKVNVSGEGVFNSKEDFWNFISEMQKPFIDALKDSNAETRNALRGEVFKASEKYHKNGKLIFKRSAYCVGGMKP